MSFARLTGPFCISASPASLEDGVESSASWINSSQINLMSLPPLLSRSWGAAAGRRLWVHVHSHCQECRATPSRSGLSPELQELPARCPLNLNTCVSHRPLEGNIFTPFSALHVPPGTFPSPREWQLHPPSLSGLEPLFLSHPCHLSASTVGYLPKTVRIQPLLMPSTATTWAKPPLSPLPMTALTPLGSLLPACPRQSSLHPAARGSLTSPDLSWPSSPRTPARADSG